MLLLGCCLQRQRHCIRAPVPGLDVLLLSQCSANLPGKAEDGPSTWVPAMHVGDPRGISGLWFKPGPTLAAVGI